MDHTSVDKSIFVMNRCDKRTNRKETTMLNLTAPARLPIWQFRAIPLFSIISLARSRRELAHLDAATLRDIGLNSAEAHRESQRAFWDIPANWAC